MHIVDEVYCRKNRCRACSFYKPCFVTHFSTDSQIKYCMNNFALRLTTQTKVKKLRNNVIVGISL